MRPSKLASQPKHADVKVVAQAPIGFPVFQPARNQVTALACVHWYRGDPKLMLMLAEVLPKPSPSGPEPVHLEVIHSGNSPGAGQNLGWEGVFRARKAEELPKQTLIRDTRIAELWGSSGSHWELSGED